MKLQAQKFWAIWILETFINDVIIRVGREGVQDSPKRDVIE